MQVRGGRSVERGPRRARDRGGHGARDQGGRAHHPRDAGGGRGRAGDPSRDLGRRTMKCRSCRGPAVIEIRRHHAAFCTEHFLAMFRTQVEKAIRRLQMMGHEDRILLAVSGGKDSLALWDVLLDLGYDVTGLYLGLGIGTYSDRSHERRSGVRGSAGSPAADRRPRARSRLRHPDRGEAWLAIDMRGLWAVEALRLQSRGARRWLRRRRDRTQPRRRGRDPAREHAALADRCDRSPVARPPRPRRDGQEGETPPSSVRAGDGRVRLPAWHRLRGRGVPARRAGTPSSDTRKR